MTKREHPVLTKLRRFNDSLPGTAEVEAWGHPTFRVGKKIYASFGVYDGKTTVGCKQTKPDQQLLVQDSRIIVAPYVGKHGWICIYADEVEWDMVEDLVETSYRLIAGKRLIRQLDEQQA